MYLVDGGSFVNASVGDPIRRCLEAEGVTYADIIVDAILPYGMIEFSHWTEDEI